MILFPNAKINLGLQVIRKRPDGFHEIATVLLPVALFDVLELVPSRGQAVLIQTGLEVDVPAAENLCMKAYELVKEEYGIDAVTMHLHKSIPGGSGLGGGSSDAASTLMALNSQFKLNIDAAGLMEMAARLGSDCPFFISNRPALATGRGELLQSVESTIDPLKVCIVKPAVNISTASAYAGISPQIPLKPIDEVIGEPMSEWKDVLSNDFELSVFKIHPEIEAIKHKLYKLGATYASMSGSGSAVFGLFEKIPDGIQDQFPDCFFWKED